MLFRSISVVKKVIKSETKATKQPAQEKQSETVEQPETTDINGLHYEIKEDTDTRDNSIIFVVKVVENLSREEYKKVNEYIRSINGYYSKFKHGFIFKNDPTNVLNETEIKQCETEQTQEKEQQENIKQAEQQQEPQEQKKASIDFEIEESQHTETKKPIWLVKIKNNLSKDEFAELKRNFATLKGFYSSFNNSFIFKYDPTEKIKQTA